MRVLIIEDDAATAQMMELMLKAEGFNVYTTDLGEEGADLAGIYDYDLITLDLNLPDINGLEVLRRIRTAKITTPVMVCSGASDIETKVKTFGGGADDYLSKPFHKDEFVARARSLIRRSKGHASDSLQVGPIVLDIDGKSVKVEGFGPLHLTGKEYQMLELLALRKGSTLSKENFLNHLYGGMDEPETKIIDVFICKLRKKLETAGAAGYIETVWGRGYRLVDTPVERTPHMQGAAASAANRDKLQTLRGRCLAVLAEHAPRDLKAGTVALRMDTDSMSTVYGVLLLCSKAGLITSYGASRSRTYSINDAGVEWLVENGWNPPEQAAAA